MIRRLLAALRGRHACRRSCRCTSPACATLPQGPGFVYRLAELDGAEIRRRLDAHERSLGMRR